MKVALLIIGHLRTFYQCRDSWNEPLLDKYDVDVFMHLWDVAGTRLDMRIGPSDDSSRAKEDLTPIEFDDEFIQKTAGFKEIVVESYSDLHRKFLKYSKEPRRWKPPTVRIVNIYSQWYKVQECFKLAEANEKYDVVIKFRPDVKIHKLPDLTKVHGGVVWTPTYPGFESAPVEKRQIESIHDWMAIGNQYDMKLFCSLYDNLTKIYEFAQKKSSSKNWQELDDWNPMIRQHYFYNPHLVVRSNLILNNLKNYAHPDIELEIIR